MTYKDWRNLKSEVQKILMDGFIRKIDIDNDKTALKILMCVSNTYVVSREGSLLSLEDWIKIKDILVKLIAEQLSKAGSISDIADIVLDSISNHVEISSKK